MFHRILRKFLAALFLEVFLEFGDEILPSAGGNGRIFLDAEASLERVQPMFEVLLRQTHHNSGIHLNKAAIGVIGKALVVYAGCERCDAPVVKPEIQNRLHHAGHGAGGAGAHANQERSLGIPELLLGDFFELGNVLCDLLFELGWKLLAILVVVIARCSGDRKTTRDGQTDSGHLRQAGPFASEEVAPSAVAFRFPCTKEINPFRHDMPHKRFGIRNHMQTARTGGRVHARRPLKNLCVVVGAQTIAAAAMADFK